jgi:hypothetical protein
VVLFPKDLENLVAYLFPEDPASLASAQSAIATVLRSSPVLLYVGPDQLLPLTSVFGAIVGIVLLFWGWVVRLVVRCWALLTRQSRTPAPESETAE